MTKGDMWNKFFSKGKPYGNQPFVNIKIKNERK